MDKMDNPLESLEDIHLILKKFNNPNLNIINRK